MAPARVRPSSQTTSSKSPNARSTRRSSRRSIAPASTASWDSPAMTDSTAFAQLGRKLRLGVIGGGPGSFIGVMHRAAATLDGRYAVVAGVLSSDPARALAAGQALDLPRPYA